MKYLFIHQNFPGQYLHLAHHLQGIPGNTVVGVGDVESIKRRGTLPGVETHGYPAPEGFDRNIHPYLRSTDAALRRGQSVVRVLLELNRKGFVPDVIAVHPAWGEGLFVRDFFPNSPILMFAEYYFRAGEADLAFDPEFPISDNEGFSARIKNTAQIVSMQRADACLCPTEWQASRYPDHIRAVTRVIHDGIDTDFMCPDAGDSLTIQPLAVPGEGRVTAVSGAAPVTLPPEEAPLGPSLTLSAKDEVIVYAARNLEPHRGFHTFMRALPAILTRRPTARVLIFGGPEPGYSRPAPGGETWKSLLLKEVGAGLDLSRVHFLGQVPIVALRAAFRIASVHVYLTYPYVLSWSMLESMACGGLVLGSDTEPVREIVEHGRNGLLTDFFDVDKLAGTLDELLGGAGNQAGLRAAARRTIEERYSRKLCLPRHIQLLADLAAGKYPRPE